MLTSVLRSFRLSYGNVIQADKLLKEYFRNRLSMDLREYENCFVQLCKQPVKRQDHRWLSLNVTLERSIDQLDRQSKLRLLKALAESKRHTSLFDELSQSLSRELHDLNIDEMTCLMWSSMRILHQLHKDQIIDYFKRIEEILTNNNKTPHDKVTISLLVEDEADSGMAQQTPQTDDSASVHIKQISLTCLLYCMAKNKSVDFVLLKILTKAGVEPNLKVLTIKHRLQLLDSYLKLNHRNKRVTLKIYQSLRKDFKQLEMEEPEQLAVLVCNISELTTRNEFGEHNMSLLEKQSPETAKELAEELTDMRKFIEWTVETLLMFPKQEGISFKTAANLLVALSKAKTYNTENWKHLAALVIQNLLHAKDIDLSMTIVAVCSLPKPLRAQFREEEMQVLDRIWIIYHTFTGKSLKIVEQLVAAKEIKPAKFVARDIEKSINEAKNRPAQRPRRQNDE